MTIKESYDVAGWATTWGVPERKDNRPRSAEQFVAPPLPITGAVGSPINPLAIK